MAAIERTSVVLLAAGLSRRYGAVGKLVANYRGKPLALHLARTLAEFAFERRIAVCRSGDDDLASLLQAENFEVVRNADPARGQSSSLALGVSAAGNPEALLVCLADMPLVTASHIRTLIAQADADGMMGSSETDGGPPMPPAVFGRAYLQQLQQLQGDKGARELLRNAKSLIAPAGTLADFDTAEDFLR